MPAADEAQKLPRQKHNSADAPLRQEEDVLDTLVVSSGLWTFSTLGLATQHTDRRAEDLPPDDLLVTRL